MCDVHDRRIGLGSIALVMGLILGVSGCGDDDSGADTTTAAPTTAAYCAELQQTLGDDDSGPFDAFYEAHPDPTPADWAADGHLVTEALQEGIDMLGSVRPSAEAQPLVDELLAAFEVMKQNSIDVIEAGKNNDQAAIDELERVNQESNVPTLFASFEAIGALCGVSSGS